MIHTEKARVRPPRRKTAGKFSIFVVNSASRAASAVALVIDGARIPFCGRRGKMQNLHDFQRDLSAESIDAVGGELLAGSGFESEEPEPGFVATELGGEE
jgi:hypothetical protein